MKQIFDTKKLAEHCNVSERTIQNWRDKGQLAHIKIGRKILYTEDHVKDFLEKYSVPAFSDS